MNAPATPEEGQRRLENAKLAYKRYGTIVGFRNFKGEPMPEFEKMNPVQQAAWCMAANPEIPLPDEAPPAPKLHTPLDDTGAAHR